MSVSLVLISHPLCPYVQRAAISLVEKGVAFERRTIDLANKPDWFLAISPLGKTPVLLVGDTAIFESAVILEYLEETQARPLHPADALKRAEHRGWIEFGSAILNDIAGLYTAADETGFEQKAKILSQKFDRLENRIVSSPYFDGAAFSLVDAVFGPIFRYFDVFDQIGDFGILREKNKVHAWREALANRPSIICAVDADYSQKLLTFLKGRNAHISKRAHGLELKA